MADPSVGVNEQGGITAKNLQEMLNKFTMDEESNKPHEFWDTQPVPKFGKSCHDCHDCNYL